MKHDPETNPSCELTEELAGRLVDAQCENMRLVAEVEQLRGALAGIEALRHAWITAPDSDTRRLGEVLELTLRGRGCSRDADT
jgi:hypothetical protein